VKATAEQGLVVVHYEQRGCDIAIAVLNCTSTKVAYHYTPRHAQQTRFAENDADLYAHFPVAVADLRGRLGADRAIRADYRMEGIDMIPIGTTIEPADLRGSECDEATHVVRAIHRGAFAVAAAARNELQAGGNLFDASAKQKLGVFDGDGFQEACDGARQKSTRTSGCDEPLRIELQPIQHPVHEAPPAPSSIVTATSPPTADPAPPAPAPRPTARRSPQPALPLPEKPAQLPAPTAHKPWAGPCPASMARIPGGTFAMGFDEDHVEGQSRRWITLPPYCLDRTEVTVGAYAGCSGCRRPGTGGQCNGPGMGKDDHPQNCVTWNDAVTFCSSVGKVLPSEAQWELAALGGAEGRRFPWGHAPATDRACHGRWSEDGRGTCPAGAFPEEAFGLHDMAGNVWEWVADWYGPFAPGDPIATPTKGVGRVIRGGGWTSSSLGELRSTSRAATWPTNRDDYLGFRCAL
jgi:formylglycine-generating enzyme required for sulfatase activity